MNQALGLIFATPALLIFILFMHRKGAIGLVGAITAAVMAVAFAAVLFFT